MGFIITSCRIISYSRSIPSEMVFIRKHLNKILQILDSHTPDIIRVARAIIEENGYSYPVKAGIKELYFPVKSYGDVTLPG